MRVLLDTNIIIHREGNVVQHADIGVLFHWLDELNYTKCIHPLTINEISTHKDQQLVATFRNKLKSYNSLKTTASDTEGIASIRSKLDRTQNDKNDTTLLNELAQSRVDLFITEDRGVHKKASKLGLFGSIFTIDSFLEKCIAENPTLKDYEVLSVRKEYFGNIDLSDPFFDSFRDDYPGFDNWFQGKSDQEAYISLTETNKIAAFLYLKVEGSTESYFDITPPFKPQKRLKIGTFKVVYNGCKLGERFIKIIFDNAISFGVEEIYVTLFDSDNNKLRLLKLLEDWGFAYHGEKVGSGGTEKVMVRLCSEGAASHEITPRLVYPYVKGGSRKWIVPIYPAYHTELFPDSLLNTEDAADFSEATPNRNALLKVYISRSIERGLRSGDIIVFYRTADAAGPAWYTSVTTTIGVVQSVKTDISSVGEFIQLCRKRSVFSDEELTKHWNFSPMNRPFVVNFLYLYSFPKRLNLKFLVENRIISQAPRGFERVSDEAFKILLGESNVDRGLVVD